MLAFNNSEIVGFLHNNEYEFDIPLKEGINIIDTESYQDVPDFQNLEKHLVLFKLNIQSESKTTLRTYENFPLVIKIRNDCYIEEANISKSTIKTIYSLSNLEIFLLQSKFNLNFGSFHFENYQIKIVNNEDAEEDKKEAETKETEVIDLRSEDTNQNKNLEFVEKEEEEEVIFVSQNLEEVLIKEKSEKSNNSNNILNPTNSLIEVSENFDAIIIPKSLLGAIKDILPIAVPKVMGKRTRSKRNLKTSVEPLEPPKSTACTICLDAIKKPSKVNGCEHMFCQACIDQWASMSNSCPLCKKEFKKIFYYDEQANLVINERNVRKKIFKYEDEENENWVENTLEHCMKCKKTNDVYLMLVCDKCKFNVCHTYCANLDMIPDEDWFCSECTEVKSGRLKDIKNENKKNNKSSKKRRLDEPENCYKKENVPQINRSKRNASKKR